MRWIVHVWQLGLPLPRNNVLTYLTVDVHGVESSPKYKITHVEYMCIYICDRLWEKVPLGTKNRNCINGTTRKRAT